VVSGAAERGASGSARRSAFGTLSAMPPAFTVSEFAISAGMRREMAHTYISRWTEAGLLRRFGPGVHFNLAAHPEAPATHLGLALAKLLGRPFVMTGAAALYHAGWTGQVQRRVEIAVPVIRGKTSLPVLEGDVTLTPRSIRHFRILEAEVLEASSGWADVPVLAPEAALADALLMEGRAVSARHPTTLPPPDEIDEDMPEEGAGPRLEALLRRLGADETRIGAAMEAYGAVLSGSQGPRRGF
jgi:hypothetical protein